MCPLISTNTKRCSMWPNAPINKSKQFNKLPLSNKPFRNRTLLFSLTELNNTDQHSLGSFLEPTKCFYVKQHLRGKRKTQCFLWETVIQYNVLLIDGVRSNSRTWVTSNATVLGYKSLFLLIFKKLKVWKFVTLSRNERIWMKSGIAKEYK